MARVATLERLRLEVEVEGEGDMERCERCGG